MQAVRVGLFVLLVAFVMLQGCSHGKYIYWKPVAVEQSDAISGLLAYQYIALNQVTDNNLAGYCQQLAQTRSSGYQLYLLQLSCAERWLAQPLDQQQFVKASTYYNAALLPLVRAAVNAQDTRSLNLTLRFMPDVDESQQAFSTFYMADDIQTYDDYIQHAVAPGLGIAVVARRDNTAVGIDRYFPPEGIFRPMTVVPVKLDFTDPTQPVLTLRGVYMASARQWQQGEQHYWLTFDKSAPYLCLVEYAVADQLEDDGLFNAEKVEDKLGIYAIEPFSAKKKPILMIHGLNSSPLIWRRLSWAIFSDPELSAKYQIWHAFYPSGPPPFFNAMRLRHLSDDLMHKIFSPSHEPNMIVIGHSMGGIIGKTFVQSTGNTLWDTTFYRTPEALSVDSQTRKTLGDIFIFNARPYVTAAIFLDTPHQGAKTADSWLGRLASAMITLPASMKKVFTNLWTGITAKDIKPAMRGYMSGYGPNSVDVLSPHHPLVKQLNRLPFQVPVYSVVGNKALARCASPLSCPSLNDSVVPYTSAHLAQAQAEIMVQSEHNSYQSTQAIEFIKEILISY